MFCALKSREKIKLCSVSWKSMACGKNVNKNCGTIRSRKRMMEEWLVKKIKDPQYRDLGLQSQYLCFVLLKGCLALRMVCKTMTNNDSN